MLLELKISHFAIIDSIQIQFKGGLNILSGETGAGKSVLLKSLALLMGEKALSDTVRSGAENATIEGLFDLSGRKDLLQTMTDLGFEMSENELVVRRVISRQGKSRVYVNGSLASLANLRQIVSPLIQVTGYTAPLIEMTSQHENKNLQSKSYHLDILDSYTGSWDLREKVKSLYTEIRQSIEKIEALKTETQNREQRLDFLIFQRDEINALDLNPGEEDALENDIKRLKNSQRLSQFIGECEHSLYSSDQAVLVQIHNILTRGHEFSNIDKTLKEKLSNLSQAKALIEEAVYELRDYEKDLVDEPIHLDDKENQLSQLRRLQKKFGERVEDILNALEKIETEIAELENSDETLLKLVEELDEKSKMIRSYSEELHRRRENGAILLEKGVNDELLDLNMKGLRFSVKVTAEEDFSAKGMSDVEFLTQNSKKDVAKPLAKYASGGELSRILLSLKCVVGQSEQPRTYLFDEVDTGVSGETAEKVGRKLKDIAKGQQVICVTHLPQVAAFADCHFVIHKTQQRKGVHMEVSELKPNDRVKEIARLISGERITKTSLDHAKQLLGV